MNALDMDESSCGFDRARSRPAKIIKGAKKVAYYSKMRHSPQSLARCLASPFFLPATTSYHEVLTVAQQAESNAARAEVEASRPDEVSVTRSHVSSSSAFSPHLTHLSLSLQRLRPNLWMEWRGGPRRQQHTRFGRGGRRRLGQSDGHPPPVLFMF
jgi:hypothetical protein